MTREEAIDWLARVKSNTVNHTLEMPLWWNEPLAEALDMAIKVIEQESVLDKIKEEIKDNTYFINETTEKEGIDFETVEKIIDKYKGESENKE